MPATAALDPDQLRHLLRGTRWSEVDHLLETGSTNRDLAGWAAGADQPVARVLVSEHQTAGRGRFNRQWTAPPRSSLALSVAFWPEREFADWTWLPLVAGVGVLRGVREASLTDGLAAQVALKWPNDVLVVAGPGQGKLCGILSERAEGRVLGRPAAVIGMGLNISMDVDELPVPTATSLALAGGSTDKTAVVAAVLRHLDELLSVWESRGHLREAYSAECSSIGAPLRVQVSDAEFVEGVGEQVDHQGRLVVRTAAGARAFSAGDVVHLRRS